MHRPDRRHPAGGILHVDGQPTIVFDTVCAKVRTGWLANEIVHQCLRQVWQAATAWRVGRYVIMPDHIHYFAGATNSPISYDRWVTYWKSQFTKQRRMGSHLWLTGHWDVRLRSMSKYEEKLEYVAQNPVRRGLVSTAKDWPFCGEIHQLRWD
jgi:REP element-mobilizing transposase RayT